MPEEATASTTFPSERRVYRIAYSGKNGEIRTKKYANYLFAEKIQADCDMKATNIIIQGLPGDIYSLVNHHRVAKDLWKRVQLLMQCTSLTKP
ncbi:hypothetical protein Tco_1517076 [Tanacetum coccineum]